MWLPVGLAVIGVAAIIVETLLPAGGLVGVAGLGAIVASIVVVFNRFGATAGGIYLAATLVVVPVAVIVYFKYFPRTFMGRRLILGDSQKREEGYASYTEERYAGLVGKEGLSLSILRPAGTVLIDGRRYSAVTAGEYVEKDRPVRVVKVEGSRIVVRKGGG